MKELDRIQMWKRLSRRRTPAAKRAKEMLDIVLTQIALCQQNLPDVERSASRLREEIMDLTHRQEELEYIIGGNAKQEEAAAPKRTYTKREKPQTNPISPPTTPTQAPTMTGTPAIPDPADSEPAPQYVCREADCFTRGEKFEHPNVRRVRGKEVSSCPECGSLNIETVKD